MNVKLIGSTLDGVPTRRQYLTSFLIDGTLAVDAGSIGIDGEPRDQERIRYVLISHAHIDHIATLPILVDNVFRATRHGLTILGSQAVLDALRAHIFNDVIWPDLVRLSGGSIRYRALEPGATIKLGGLSVTPIAVDHVVPTLGFLVADRRSAVLFPSDTGPTDDLWRVANAVPTLRGVFLEAAFPDHLAELATASKHLTPATFAHEVAKLAGIPRVIAVHIKPRFHREITDELNRLALPNVEVGVPGGQYHF